jgi:ubiquinone biosynthesis monooxygenase Coq7
VEYGLWDYIGNYYWGFMAKTTAEIASILRVNHAGEYGAKRIYAGQIAVTKNAHARKIIEEMQAQEQEHLDYFEAQMRSHAVRPTILQPLWHVGGWVLGAATAAMGEKAAFACTVAVESVIAEHYESQLENTASTPDLHEKIAQFRQDEMEHHDTSLEQGAEKAVAYTPLYHAIRGVTKLAIGASKRW